MSPRVAHLLVAAPGSRSSTYLLTSCCAKTEVVSAGVRKSASGLALAISARLLTRLTQIFCHTLDRQIQVVRQSNSQLLDRTVAARGIEWYSGQGCRELDRFEIRPANRCFALVQNRPSDPAARPRRMNEECADARRAGCWIELGIVAARLVIAAKKCFAFAPAAAADDLPPVGSGHPARRRVLDNKIRLVANKLPINAKY